MNDQEIEIIDSLNRSQKIKNFFKNNLKIILTLILLILLTIFGYFVFNEIPDFWTWIGGIVVFSSVLVITYFEKNKEEKNKKNILSSVE